MIKKLSEQLCLGRRLAGVTTPISRKRMKWGRNCLCLCGSGVKYKKCCMSDIDNLTDSDDNATIDPLPEDIQKMIDARNKGLKKNG